MSLTYNELVNYLVVRLGNRSSLRSRIENELQFTKDYVVERDPHINPWFLLTEGFISVPTVADQNYVDLPVDFKAEYQEGFLYLDDEVTPLSRDSVDILTARLRQGETDGTGSISSGDNPSRYSIVGNRLHLFPTPNSVKNLKLKYYATTGRLRDEPDNKWLSEGADWLMNEAGARVAQDIQNIDQWKILQANAIRGRHRIMAETLERELVNLSGLPE